MGGWVKPHGRLGPACHLGRAKPSLKKKVSSKIILKKIVIFHKYFYCILINIG